MKALRKHNPLMFDLALFLSFTIMSFLAFAMTDAWGVSGAVISVGALVAISLMLIFSR
jgi:hypothetical protein